MISCAVTALVAGRRRRTIFAVERLGENARGGGLAYAAHAGKEIGMGDAVGPDSVLQRAGDMAPGPRYLQNFADATFRATTR